MPKSLGIVCLLLLAPIRAQETVIRVDVSLVTLGVRVTDGRARDVPDLTAANFSIYENGAKQQISFFSREEQAVSLGILLDKSDSMSESGKLEKARNAALSLVRSSHGSNEFFYLPFDDQYRLPGSFISDRERLQSRILETRSEGGGTSLYDALAASLEFFSRAQHPRQALVVITDGADQHSETDLDALIEKLQASQVQVFAIGYFSREEDAVFRESGKTIQLIGGPFIDNPRHVFKRLSEESGAEAHYPKSDQELQEVLDTISQDLRRQYTLAYYPSDPSNRSYRRIEVKVNRRGLRVRSRQGYRLQEPGEPLTAAKGRSSPHSDPSYHRPAHEKNVERQGDRTVYRDDFSDPTGGWPNNPGAAFYHRGAYHLRQARNLPFNGPAFGDFRASITMEMKTGPHRPTSETEMQVLESAGAGLVFRFNENGFYAFLVASPARGRGHFKLIKQIGRKVEDLILWTPDPSLGTVNQLTVACRGSHIELYLNSRLVRTLKDEGFSSGRIGLIITGEGEAVFDDLRVESIP